MLSLSNSVLQPQSTNPTNAFTFLSVAIDLFNYWMTGKNPNIAEEVNSLVESMRSPTLSSNSETFLGSRRSLKSTNSKRLSFLRRQSISQVDFQEKKHLDLSSISPTRSPTFPMILTPTRAPIQSPTYSPTLPPLPQSIAQDFPVNTYHIDDQSSPAIAALKDGGFFVTWQSFWCCQPGEDQGIIGQRYNSAGIKVDGELFINDPKIVNAFSQDSAIAVLNNGNFVVTWSDHGQDRDFNKTIYGQLFTPSAIKIGKNFQVSRYLNTDDSVSAPAITALSDGGFVITWRHRNASGYLWPYEWNYEILGQQYTSSGIKNGTEFQVSWHSNTHDIVDYPDIFAFNDDGFIITYSYSKYDFLNRNYVSNVFGQKYSMAGVKNGAEFQVNAPEDSSYYSPQSASTALNLGGFVVAWITNNGTNLCEIFGQQYDNAGMKSGSKFQVNAEFVFSCSGSHLVITALNDGGFLITWDFINTSDGVTGYQVLAQRYNNLGMKSSAIFQVNSYTAKSYESIYAVADLEDGGFVVTWAKDITDSFICSEDDDLNGYNPGLEIVGQRFDTNGNRIMLPSQSYESSIHPCANSNSSNTTLIIGLVIGFCGFSTLVLALSYYCGICLFVRGNDKFSNAYAPPSDSLTPTAEEIGLTPKSDPNDELIPDAYPVDSAPPSSPPLLVTAEIIQEDRSVGVDDLSNAGVDDELMLRRVVAFFPSATSALTEQDKPNMRI